MTKRLLLVIFLAAAHSSAFGQAPSMSFTGPTTWTPGASVTLSANLSFSGFSALSFSYWLQDSGNTLAPFLSITSVSHFVFPFANYTGPFPVAFNAIDLGGTVDIPPGTGVSAGTYHVTDMTFSLAAGAPAGTYTLLSTTLSPRVSSMTDTNFSDHPIAQGSFIFTVVPEPNTLALLGFGAIGSGLLICRRRKTSRHSD